ncbi:MAG: ABC transporter substrate-binding protein [Cohaesibacter sp.]|nr:ABC transporter substrate-binding protein [Cohaesibacter sp.]
MKYLLIALALICSNSVVLADQTRLFVDGQGHEVRIPIKAKRIVSLRGEQFTAPLIELGAPIVGSTGLVQEAIHDGKPFIRGAHDLFHTTFEGSDIAFVGAPKQPDIEAIAALKPDLILVPDFASDSYDQLSAIAPSVVINIWSNSARERYRRIADAVGRLDRFQKLEATFDFRLARAKALTEKLLGDPSKISVAIAEVRGKRFRVYKNYGAMSYILKEMGFSRPDIIENIDGDRLDLSPEQVQAIDADFLVSSYADHFGQPPADLRANWDNLIPGWHLVLHAPRNNQHILIDREPMRALSFRSMEEILAIYLANIVTRDFKRLGE